MKRRKVKLSKIPSIFKNVDLPPKVLISDIVHVKEGAFVVAQVQENTGKKDDLDFANGRLGKVVKGDIIPGVLGYRKASVEFAGSIPESAHVGDDLYLLCESGLMGAISGVYESWGQPLKVKLMGAIVDSLGKSINLKRFTLPKVNSSQTQIPIIAFLGTRMDCGKTTMACKVVHYFTKKGKKVAAVKATGTAFTQDPYKLKEHGADPVVDFVDMGLPSTCNGNADEVVASCINLINYVKSQKPDLIVLEFGDSIIGEYHCLDILKNKIIKNQLSFIVLAAYDFAGVYGAKDILKDLGLTVDFVTGPVVNSQIGVKLIKKYFGFASESNQYNIPKTISLIKKVMGGKA